MINNRFCVRPKKFYITISTQEARTIVISQELTTGRLEIDDGKAEQIMDIHYKKPVDGMIINDYYHHMARSSYQNWNEIKYVQRSY